MFRLVKVSIATLVLGIAVIVCLLSASVYTFSQLTEETLIAEVQFEQVGEAHYLAHLRTGDRCEERVLTTYGDQWRIDAQFVKWKYWALLLGLDSQYRLDRFEGRYQSVEQQNEDANLAHDLRADNTLDLVELAESLGPLNMLVDASYGSSTYQDIDTSLVHAVYKTPTGIFTRPRPERPAQPGADALAIEINRGCGGEPGPWQRFTQWADAHVVAAVDVLR